MAEINPRIQRVVEELVGNESLLEMLETEAATEMLNWGIAMATWVVENTSGDASPESVLLPRLKAIRQTMRLAGNWAAGKYADPADRIKLRDRLLQQFKVIFGEEARLPSADMLDGLLNQVDNRARTAYQLILQLRAMLDASAHGGKHA